jgi:hypothetical protein
MEKSGSFFLAIALVVGLSLGAFILGRSFEKFKSDDRYISVKGFSEREVKSDFVIWSLKIRTATDNLLDGNKTTEASRKKIIEFLTKNGIETGEIIPQGLNVTDRQANEYVPPNAGNIFRYVIEETIEVRSNHVDVVQKVSRMTSELLNAGVALTARNEWDTGLKYLFTKLNTIKPEMLAEATRNASQAAEQFTKESKTELGKMRKASQGLFSIMDRDQSLSNSPEGGYASGTADLYKKIRVVVSVDYSIK